MNAPTTTEAPVNPLNLLRAPFPAHQISKLPKPTKRQTEDVKADFKKGARCNVCGSWHHPDVVHLDYVGHAALTDRLLDTDIKWDWEPMAYTPEGLPLFDKTGGLWIRLTVCGKTRIGYGHAADKGLDPGARDKEVIGDALRNAAMRFGAALDLWHKGDLHIDADESDEPKTPLWITAAKTAITCLETEDACGAWYKANVKMLKDADEAGRVEVLAYLKARKTALKPEPPKTYAEAKNGAHGPPQGQVDPFDDEIPF